MLDAAGVTDPAERARLDALLADRPRAAGRHPRAGWRLHPPGARRRPAAHHRGAADRAQPARLRPVPPAQRVRRAGRRAAGRPAAGPARGRRQGPAGDGGDGAVGHRQPEDRGRPDRAGAVADGRRAALRQLRPAVRRPAAAAGATRPPAGRRGDHAVRHLPRPAAAADQAAGRGRAAGRQRRRARGGELRPQARAGLHGAAWRHDGAGGAARVRQRRRRLRQQRQPAGRLRRVERRGRAGRGVRRAQGLRLRRVRPAASARRRCWTTCWPAWTSPTRTSTRVELGVTTVDHYFDTLGGITRAVRRARGGTAAPVYIGDQTRGDGRCARCPSRCRSRRAPGRSTRNGTRRC